MLKPISSKTAKAIWLKKIVRGWFLQQRKNASGIRILLKSKKIDFAWFFQYEICIWNKKLPIFLHSWKANIVNSYTQNSLCSLVVYIYIFFFVKLNWNLWGLVIIQKSMKAWLSIDLVSEFWTLPKYWPSTQLPNKRLVIENLVHISLTKLLLFCPVRGAENLPNWVIKEGMGLTPNF